MIPIQGVVVSQVDLDAQTAELEQAQQKLMEANALIVAQADQIKTLMAQLAPKPASPKITRTTLPRLAGLTLENGQEAPSQAGYERLRRAMAWGKSMGLNACRFFLNADEVRAHVAGTGTLGNLPAYARQQGLRFIADTVDSIVPKMSDGELRLYMDGLAALGCEGVYINDADRKELSLTALKLMVKRIRDAAPNMPIFASLTASANLETYRGIVDHVEIQTFGSLSEFVTFARKDAILCLDFRKAMSARDIKARLDILAKQPRNIFVYADLPQDYIDAPDDEDGVLRDFMGQWKAMG